MLKGIKILFELVSGLFATVTFILLFPLISGLLMPLVYGGVYKEQHKLKDFLKEYLIILLNLLKPKSYKLGLK